MSGLSAKGKGTATISARDIRADGTIEDLGVIAEMKKESLFRKLLPKLKLIFLLIFSIIFITKKTYFYFF